MPGFTEENGVLCADGVPLPKIAAEMGTPTYVYSASVIESQYRNLNDALARVLPEGRRPLLCYACKASSNIAILNLLNRLGSGLEIVSEGELLRGLKAGFNPEKIVATGVGKTRGEIANYLKTGIHQLNVESLPELEHINTIADEMGKKAKVVFRLNPNVSGGGHHKISTGRKHDKFGIDMKTTEQAYAMAKEMPHVEPLGLSMHIGSQVFEVEKFREAFSVLPDFVKKLRAQGHTVSRLDIGGGFPIIYKDEKLLDLDAYAQWVRDIIAPLDTEIIMEPGRYMAGNSAVLLTEVLYVKESDERKFLIIDAAMNDLIRPAMYDAWHGIEPVTNRNAPKSVYDVVGPVCETGDTFTRDRELPEMKQGDLAVIKSAGAYGMSMASNYNTRRLPAEIMTHNGVYTVIRPRQTYEDVFGSETLGL
jgi:diaminopimelate decarboxylase